MKDGKTDELAIPPDVQDAPVYITCGKCCRLSQGPPDLDGASTRKNYKMDVRVGRVENGGGNLGKRETARVVVIMPFQGIFLNEAIFGSGSPPMTTVCRFAKGQGRHRLDCGGVDRGYGAVAHP